MSGTHALDQAPAVINWWELGRRSAHQVARFGGSVLGVVNRFETAMTARSLSEDYVRQTGLAALRDIDSTYADDVEDRLAS